MSAADTIRIAHTAKCKLHLAANHPNRNFRLILGHALTLDKVMLRVAEIESDSSDDGDEEGVADEEPSGPQQRRVSFSAASRARHAAATGTPSGDGRKRSPPPQPFEHDDDAADDDDEIEDDDDAGELSLQRFPSAAAQPPRMIQDEGDDDPEEPISPPLYTPSEDELKQITGGAGNPELANQYRNVVRCPCSKHHSSAPKVSNVWEIPNQKGGNGGRVAVVQVEE